MKNKNKKSILLGVFVIVLTVGLNVRHILDNYGVKGGNRLHVEVLAQNTTTDGGSSSGGYTIGVAGTNWKVYTIECTVSQSVNITLSLQPLGVGGSVSIGSTTSYVVNREVCGKGAGFCLAPAGC